MPVPHRTLVVATFALALAAGGAFGQLFSTPRYPVGSSPYSIAAGDFNGDLKPDLVASNYGGSTLSVLMSNAADPTAVGGYSPATTLFVGDGPYMVAAADADGDGKLDLISADYASNRLSLMKGLGGGGFAALVALSTGVGPCAVAVADFDGNGSPDVASANFDQSSVGVVYGNGAGGFSPVHNTFTGFHPNHLVAGDFTGDGRPDVVTADYHGATITLLAADAAGMLGIVKVVLTSDFPFSLASGDIDGDGDLDLALSLGSKELRLFRNDGAGTPVLAQTLGLLALPTGVAMADVTGDGKRDVILATFGFDPNWVGDVNVYAGNGTGVGVVPKQVISGGATTDVVVADLDGDGDLDVASTNSTSNDVTVHRNLGGGVLAVPAAKTAWPTSFHTPTDLAAGDLNDDGILDVVTSAASDNRVSSFRGHGDGAFDLPTHTDLFDATGGILLGDRNGDHVLDFVASRTFFNDVVTGIGNGNGGFFATFVDPGGSAGIGRLDLGDMNGDGVADLLSAHANGPPTIHWGDTAGDFQNSPAPVGFGPSVDVRIADMNADGLVDIVQSTGTEMIAYQGIGGSSWVSGAHSQLAGAQRFAIADLNADGRLDAVAGSGGSVVVYPMTTNFAWSPPTTYPVLASGSIVPRLADLDADGLLDVVAGNGAAGSEPVGLSVLLGKATSGFAAPTHYQFGTSPLDIAIADVDADGRPDVVMSCQNAIWSQSSELVVMRNLLPTPPGVATFGTGTPGAYGRLGMNTSSSAKVGNAAFAIACTNAPRTTLGVGLVGTAASVAGSDPFGLGILLHVDVFLSLPLFAIDFVSDAQGLARTKVPIPAVAGLAGATLFAQTIWVEDAVADQLTSDAALGLVSSKGLSFTILP